MKHTNGNLNGRRPVIFGRSKPAPVPETVETVEESLIEEFRAARTGGDYWRAAEIRGRLNRLMV